MKLRSLVSMVLMASVLVITSSCEKDPEGPTKNIWELVSENADLTLIKAEFEAAQLQTFLQADGEFTFFAPSNSALTNLLLLLGQNDFSNVAPDVVEQVLTYHILEMNKLRSEMAEGDEYTTMQGEILAVVSGSSGLELDYQSATGSTSAFVGSQKKATNGTLHVVDGVLVPPTLGALIGNSLGTIGQPIFLAADFTQLAAAVQKADVFVAEANNAGGNYTPLFDILTDDQNRYTMFAIPNDVFDAVPTLSVELIDGQSWYGLILNHIIKSDGTSGVVYGPNENQTSFTAGDTFTSMLGGTLRVLADTPLNLFDSTGDTQCSSGECPEAEGYIVIQNASLQANGTIHAFAGVLTVPQ